MKRKIVATAMALAILLGGSGIAYAAPYDTLLSTRNSDDTATVTTTVTPQCNQDGDHCFLGYKVDNGGIGYYQYFFPAGGIGISGANFYVSPDTIEYTSGVFLRSVVDGKASSSDLSSLASGIPGTVASTIASLLSNSTSTLSTSIAAYEGNWTATSGPSVILNKPTIPNVEMGSCTTDSSGNCTWTYPTAFSGTPKVVPAANQGTTGTLTNAQVTSKNSTSVTIHVNTLASVLGLLTLTGNPSGIVIDITAGM